MARVVKLAVVALAAMLPAIAVAHNVKHIVVLMMENRYGGERRRKQRGIANSIRACNGFAGARALDSQCDAALIAPIRDAIA